MNNAPVTAEDLYLYAMGLLDHTEQSRIATFLQQSPEATAELGRIRGDLALLALTSPLKAPSPTSRQRLMLAISREPRVVEEPNVVAPDAKSAGATADNLVSMPVAEAEEIADTVTLKSQAEPQRRHEEPIPFRSFAAEEPRERSFAGALVPWLGWAVAAGLAVTAWDFHQQNAVLTGQVQSAQADSAREKAATMRAQQVLETMQSSSAQRFVLARQNTQPPPSARVTYLASSGSLVFQGSNLDPLPPYKTYELWLIPTGEGAKPIPAGNFKPDAKGFASVLLPHLPAGIVASTFGVTIEDDGGAQTPTLPILMIGS